MITNAAPGAVDGGAKRPGPLRPWSKETWGTRFWARLVAITGAGLVACSALAQSSGTAEPAALPNCSSAEHHQFDFWAGSWDVVNQGNPSAPPARNEIELMHDGCVVRETYRAGAFSGSSLSFYDRQDGKWHQTWIDFTGSSLFLEGGLDDEGRMVMSRTRPDGTLDRITWTPNSDGTVRQHWQVSSDEGKTWSDAFDGLYKPRSALSGR